MVNNINELYDNKLYEYHHLESQLLSMIMPRTISIRRHIPTGRAMEGGVRISQMERDAGIEFGISGRRRMMNE